ncbi:MAG: hypothetical protein ACSHYB_05120 [Roseibacillus sp.]
MKTSSLALASFLSLGLPSLAADGIWSEQTGGSWSDSTNWSGNTIASGPGAYANFRSQNWANALAVDLDIDITVGQLLYRDNGGVNRDMTLNSSSGKILTLAGGGIQSPPEISALNRSLTINASIAGTEGASLSSLQGGRFLNLQAPSLYTGNTLITPGGGTVLVGSAASLGTGTVTVQDDADAADIDLRLESSQALSAQSSLTIENNAKVFLNFTGNTLLVDSLTINGSSLAGGTYDATTHPNSFSGTGSITTPFSTNGDGNWINLTESDVSWTDPTMWENGVIAFGVDRIADFHNGGQDHLSGKTVDLSTDITIAQIIYRDSGSPNRDLVFASENGSELIMATTTGSPLIWALNRSIYLDVPISGNSGLSLRSDNASSPGVTLRQRNSYTGLTTIIDSGGSPTITYPGDLGDSDVLVENDTSDSGVELELQHSLAIRPAASLEIESGATILLDFGTAKPNEADPSDMYLTSLVLGADTLPPGIYNASTHPSYLQGEGEIVVQISRSDYTLELTPAALDELNLSWKSIYGKVYDIEESTTLLPDSWSTIGTVNATPPDNASLVTSSSDPAAFYRIGERADLLPAVRAGVIAKLDFYITNNYLVDQNTTPGDIRNGQFHNSDNMRQSECTPVLVYAYLQPDSQYYQDPAVLEAAIRSVDYMVRGQGINGGFNENHGWCGVPNRTNGKSSVTGFTFHALGSAIELMAGLPEMQPRLLELMDQNGTGTNTTVRRTAWQSMLSQAMPFQFSGNGRGHAPNQDLCALMGVYKINDAYAALTNGTLLKTPAEIAVLSNEIFYGQPSAASSRPDGKWFTSTGMLGEHGHDFYGYDGNYGVIVTLNYLGVLAPHDAIAANFLATLYAESIQYFLVPDSAAKIGVFAENAISRRSTGDPLNQGILPLGLTHTHHPAMQRLYGIAMPYFAAAAEANISFSSPNMFQVGVWMYCEWLEQLSEPVETDYRVPAERNEAWTFTDTTFKTQVSKTANGPITFYVEHWDDAATARRHIWNLPPETIPSLGVFP